jgi:hypothetical protein
VIVVLFTIVKLVKAISSTAAPVAPVKPVPVIVIVVPPFTGPDVGLTELTAGSPAAWAGVPGMTPNREIERVSATTRNALANARLSSIASATKRLGFHQKPIVIQG